MQLFNPLNGDEVKKVIIADIARTLEADTELQEHICFPRVSWKWKLEMKIYPRTPEEKNIEVVGEAVQVKKESGAPVVPETSSHTREVYSSPSREVTAPDQVREEVGMPVNQAKSALSPFTGKKSGAGGNAPVIEVGKAAVNPLTMPRQAKEG